MAVDTQRIFGVTQERYDELMSCVEKFTKACHDPNEEPVNVFPPIPEARMAEMEQMRAISATLQQQKEDYLKQAEQQKKDDEAKKIAESEEKKVEEEQKKTEEKEEEEVKSEDK